MKFKATVLVVIPVLLIAAAALFYWYVRGQTQPPIVIDDPAPVSSQPIEQTPIENIVIPEITVPAPDVTMPTQGDALTPETVLPDAPTPAPEVKPEVEPNAKDDKQPTSPPKDTPRMGKTNDNGQIWIDGFGWVDPPAGVEVEIANNAGTGDIIGY